jgi:type I restriction enzyme S subunit
MGDIMEEKKNIPAIRFKGFKGEWEERKLGEIMNVTSVKRIHQSDWTNTGIRFLRARDIVSIYKNENPSEYLYITKEKYFEYSLISGKVNTNDLLVTGVGTIGVPLLIKSDDPIYFKDGNIIWFKNENAINGNFLYYSFVGNRIQGYIKDSAGIGTVGTYTIESGKKTPLYFSTKQEQSQIGTFFQNLDKQITLEQQKHDKLVTLKKAMLEKMFPKEGASVPEIRFEGFEGEWEESNIKEIFNYLRPDNYIVSTEDYSDDFDTPVLTANKAFILGYTNETRTYDYPCVIIDDFTLDFKYVDFPFMVKSSALKILTIKNVIKYDLIFIFNLFQTLKFEIMGHARHYIGVVQQMSVLTPSPKEQSVIGSYFQNLDTLISLQQQKIDKLKNIKKACLDKMFV